MKCTLEFSEPLIRIDFYCKENKQKILIDMLLRYSRQHIDGLAELLDISVKILQDVQSGTNFLNENTARKLTQLFLIFIGD